MSIDINPPDKRPNVPFRLSRLEAGMLVECRSMPHCYQLRLEDGVWQAVVDISKAFLPVDRYVLSETGIEASLFGRALNLCKLEAETGEQYYIESTEFVYPLKG